MRGRRGPVCSVPAGEGVQGGTAPPPAGLGSRLPFPEAAIYNLFCV